MDERTDYRDDENVRLFLAWQRGDKRAFDRLFTRWERPLMRWLTNLTGDAALADELYQETWMTVIRITPDYQPRAQFKTWLYGIARSRWIDAMRRQSRRVATAPIDEHHCQIPDQGDSAFALAEAAQYAEAYRRCLPDLPDEQREAFLLRTLQDLEWRDIAAITGTSADGARSRFRYATAKLKQCMGLA